MFENTDAKIRKAIARRSLRDILVAIAPPALAVTAAVAVADYFIDPAPPKHVVITTGEDEGDYQVYAKKYQDFLKEYGVDLEIRTSQGPLENLRRLEDDDSGVDIGFGQDGFGSPSEQPDIVSLGSLYYEPLWVFYRGQSRIYKRYGELKFLETQVKSDATVEERLEFLKRLDEIEHRVNTMKLPIDFSEHLYSLRGHIEFVRTRIRGSAQVTSVG